MKLAKQLARWGSAISIGHYVCSAVLKSLQPIQVEIRYCGEERIAVVDAWAYDGNSKHIGKSGVKEWSNMSEGFKMKIDDFAYARYMITKRKMIIKSDASDFDRFRRGDRKISNDKVIYVYISLIYLLSVCILHEHIWLLSCLICNNFYLKIFLLVDWLIMLQFVSVSCFSWRYY